MKSITSILVSFVLVVQATRGPPSFEGSAFPLQTRTPQQAAAAVGGSPRSSSSSNAPPTTNGMDAATVPALISLIKRIHSTFNAAQEDPTHRPVYAPTDIVNRAFMEWNSVQEGRCKDNQVEAIFSTPIGCMAELVPGRTMIHIGVPRTSSLIRRNTCKYTRVQCVGGQDWMKTPQQLVQVVQKELQDKRPGSAFWFQNTKFATRAVANEAFKQMFPKLADGDVCRAQQDGAIAGQQKTGSVFAKFANSEECLQGQTGPQCRVVMVTCLD